MFARKLQIVALVSGIALPMLMGQGCPGADGPNPLPKAAGANNGGGVVAGAQPTTLLSNSVAQLGAGGWVFTGLTFNPTSAGKVVNVNISGNATGSRPAILVYDSVFNIVAQQQFPVTNTTAVSFVSNSTGQHHIYAFEAGQPSSLYTVSVTQQP